VGQRVARCTARVLRYLVLSLDQSQRIAGRVWTSLRAGAHASCTLHGLLARASSTNRLAGRVTCALIVLGLREVSSALHRADRTPPQHEDARGLTLVAEATVTHRPSSCYSCQVPVSSDSAPNIAIFCDYENVALGVRDAKFESFDIALVLARLLDKGKVVVKKAYSDWERYKSARRALHEAGFELIEIPHVSYSGKNSADIRLVVDALDLCYTKGHVDVFAIVSGDSDFSPLVSKLRENDKQVIGLGVKNSSSDLLIENASKSSAKVSTRTNAGEKPSDETTRQVEALELVLETVEALFRDRDDNIWGSMIKQTLKRKRPSFSESFHGYRNFNELLEDAQTRGLLELQKDEKSGGYIVLSFGPNA
jgi:uncharacterized protein (TIGR00288 family)